ncbi:MAG TPA: crotonase/enoyl-CoA hydratase family protein [Pseudonocardia sp.]|jgi:enoyl-CoA hydratase
MELPALVSLDVRVTDHVAEVTLLGPGQGNAMGPDLFRELPLVFAAIEADPRVRAVTLTGSGDNFCYGLDLVAMAPLFNAMLDSPEPVSPRVAFRDELIRLQEAMTAVARCRVPVIAAISGWCIGGGVDISAAADIRLASSDAIFSVREAKMAIVADIGSLQRLVGIIGEGHLRELAFTGKNIDAARAERIGLVNEVYPDRASLLDAARALAAEIAANSPLAVHGTKEMLNAEREQRVTAGLRYVAAWNAAFLPSHDLAEALRAFSERRTPNFHGD